MFGKHTGVRLNVKVSTILQPMICWYLWRANVSVSIFIGRNIYQALWQANLSKHTGENITSHTHNITHGLENNI